ncbi:hypothetical protein N9H93_01520 [Rhizobiaceae bacterium]|nr:hypothetical protein [Rhizobiaceae bacterium]
MAMTLALSNHGLSQSTVRAPRVGFAFYAIPFICTAWWVTIGSFSASLAFALASVGFASVAYAYLAWSRLERDGDNDLDVDPTMAEAANSAVLFTSLLWLGLKAGVAASGLAGSGLAISVGLVAGIATVAIVVLAEIVVGIFAAILWHRSARGYRWGVHLQIAVALQQKYIGLFGFALR